jgi:CO/xanthine dehydrogenase FAD-binding subunit
MLKYSLLGSVVATGSPVTASGSIPVEKCRRSNLWLRTSRLEIYHRSMTLWKNYHVARNLNDALDCLVSGPGAACLIAGGTDLLLDMQQSRHPTVDTLVDVTQIPEMTALEIRKERLFVGASVPLNRVVASPLVAEHAQALKEAAALIGGPQVRNTATLGGNVAHALPAGDGTISLLALDAHAEIYDDKGYRKVPLAQLFQGPGRSTLIADREILVGFYLPLSRPGSASAFRRVMRPQGVAIAILNMGIWVLRQENIVQDVRIAVGPAGPKPLQACSAEDALRSQPLNSAHIQAALQALLSEARFRTSPHRSSADYRFHLAGVLFDETLRAAWDRTL